MINPDEFEVFMQNYQDMVFSTAVRLLGSETEAADIAQETFLRAYDRFPELKGMRSAGGWLKKVATNLCLNHLSRYRFRWRFFSELKHDDADEEFVDQLPAVTRTDEPLALAERQQAVETALQRLPAHQRVPLVLYHFDDLSYEDIARRLGVSLSKVKTDIHRGREALRKRLEGVVRDEEPRRSP
jgi:RNA polymerase sigma-70 factor, ECF subfamily